MTSSRSAATIQMHISCPLCASVRATQSGSRNRHRCSLIHGGRPLSERYDCHRSQFRTRNILVAIAAFLSSVEFLIMVGRDCHEACLLVAPTQSCLVTLEVITDERAHAVVEGRQRGIEVGIACHQGNRLDQLRHGWMPASHAADRSCVSTQCNAPRSMQDPARGHIRRSGSPVCADRQSATGNHRSAGNPAPCRR